MKTVIGWRTAQTLDYLLATHETPARAAHDCSISLQAIRPYSDSRLENVRDILRRMDRLAPLALDKWREAIRRIAAEAPAQ